MYLKYAAKTQRRVLMGSRLELNRLISGGSDSEAGRLAKTRKRASGLASARHGLGARCGFVTGRVHTDKTPRRECFRLVCVLAPLRRAPTPPAAAACEPRECVNLIKREIVTRVTLFFLLQFIEHVRGDVGVLPCVHQPRRRAGDGDE